MSAVAAAGPSGDVMFAMSLGLSGHPSPPLSLPTSTAAPFPLVSLHLPHLKTLTTISPVCYYWWKDAACPVNQKAPPPPYPRVV